MGKIKTIVDVVENQLCTGCGACAFIEPNVFYMADTFKYGKRPFMGWDANTLMMKIREKS